MTEEVSQLLLQASGANIDFDRQGEKVLITGSPEQTKQAERLLNRVAMHCHWGCNESKVTRLLKPRPVQTIVCRLSPMSTLPAKEKMLTTKEPLLSIGKDQKCDVIVQDAIISRQHCVLQLDEERGSVYVIDYSTNGTFLNGRRLPTKQSGKVLISHGDELLLRDPSAGGPAAEFGYIVNFTEIGVKVEVEKVYRTELVRRF